MRARVKFILNEPRNPKNIGASARGMANFGFRDLAVVNPYSRAWRETRSAVNAGPVVEKAKKYDSLRQALRSSHLVIGSSAGSRRSEAYRWIGLEELRELVHGAAARGERVALVFGSERSGLSNDDLAHCHYLLRLPTAAECPSMNLSQAVAVTACAIRFEESLNLPKKAKPQIMPSDAVERVVARGLKAFAAAGLLKGWDKRSSETRIRKAFHRWGLTDVDVAMLHGLFAWVLKRTK